MKKLIVAVTVLAFFIGGCVEDPVMTDEENIYSLLSSSSMVSMGALDSQGDDKGGRDVGIPEVWWRELIAEGVVTVLLENDPATGVCTVTVTRNLDAVFYIDVIHNGQIELGEKSIEDFRRRRVIVEHTGDASSAHGGWTVTALTPATYGLRNEVDQEVFISAMRLYCEGELVWECTDPDQFYDINTEIPTISEGDFLRFEAEAIHTNPVLTPEYFIYVHGPCPTWPRHLMYDNGEFGDQVADDGVYTYEWYAEESQLHHRWGIAADVIDADTMEDSEEEDYDSGAWGMPMKRE